MEIEFSRHIFKNSSITEFHEKRSSENSCSMQTDGQRGMPNLLVLAILRTRLNFMFCWPCILVWLWVNDQLDAQLRYIIVYYYNPLHVSSNSVRIIRRSNCINTVSGIVLSVSDCPMCRLRRNNLTSWWQAQSCSKHVEDYNNKRII